MMSSLAVLHVFPVNYNGVDVMVMVTTQSKVMGVLDKIRMLAVSEDHLRIWLLAGVSVIIIQSQEFFTTTRSPGGKVAFDSSNNSFWFNILSSY